MWQDNAIPAIPACPYPSKFLTKTKRMILMLLLQVLNFVLRILIFGVGFVIILGVNYSAMRTFVLARSARDPLTVLVFRTTRRIFNWRMKKVNTYEERDRMMALYAPMALLSLPVIWLTLVGLGYAMIYIAMGVSQPDRAIELSGSSLLTLGFINETSFAVMMVEFSEGVVGLILIAILIAYLPTMYAAFSKRETLVTLMEVRAGGSPPFSLDVILLAHSINGLHVLAEMWREWEVWFAEVEENHTTLPALVFFRSTRSERSWITAAGAVLDTASLYASTLNTPSNTTFGNAEAGLCIRAGYLCLRYIAAYFQIDFHPDPHFPDQPISVSQAEFDEVYNQLVAAGVPVKPDREQCWKDFAGWRVNYDTVLLRLSAITMAPYAQWSSDRSLPGTHGKFTQFER